MPAGVWPKTRPTLVLVFADLMIFAMGESILFAMLGPAARKFGVAASSQVGRSI